MAIAAPLLWSCSDDTRPVTTSGTTADGPIDVSALPGRIVFSYDTGIWARDAAGENRVQLTSNGEFDPTWSPDGTMIEFNSNSRGGHGIWVMNADGSNQRFVTRNHGEYPSWSPDSESLTYSGGSYYDIRRVNVDGSDDALVIGDPAYEMGPAWSPDGKWLTFSSDGGKFGGHMPGRWEKIQSLSVYVVRQDGSGLRQKARVARQSIDEHLSQLVDCVSLAIAVLVDPAGLMTDQCGA